MSKQEQIEELQRQVEGQRKLADTLLKQCTAATIETQKAKEQITKMRVAWAANFSQEAAFFRTLADRAENRVKAITGEYEV